jgi:hypothetical protein
MLCVRDMDISLLRTPPEANCFKPTQSAMKRPEIHLKDVTTSARRGSQRVLREASLIITRSKRDPVLERYTFFTGQRPTLRTKNESPEVRKVPCGGDTPASAR